MIPTCPECDRQINLFVWGWSCWCGMDSKKYADQLMEQADIAANELRAS